MPIATATGATIEVDGKALPPAVSDRVAEVAVEHDVHLPASFEVRIADPDRTATTGVPVRIGSTIRISGAAVDGDPRPLLSGEVTAIEAEYAAEAGSFLIVRGFDLAHRLHRGRRTRVFTQAKYSDVVAQVASAAGLAAGAIDDSGQVKDHIPQVGQSDWAFLRELAREIDAEVSIVDGKVNFRSPTNASEAPAQGTYGSRLPLQLIFGEDLLEFRPRVSAVGQVDSVEVRAWDGANKQAIVGSAQAASSSAALADAPASLSKALGSAKLVSVEPRAIDQASADKRAARVAQLVGSTFAEAVGIARGNPEIVAGRAISVSVVGDTFVGSYTLTHTRHRFDERGYRTDFIAGGRQDRSLLGLLRNAEREAVSPPAAALAGVVTAVVTDVTDPIRAGRVKLRFEWLAADYVTDWSRVTMLGAGPSRGAVWLPEVGDEVLVAFEHGDPRRPIVIGGLWNAQDAAPPYGVPNGSGNARAFVSKKGHKVVLDDDDGAAGSIRIETAGGLSMLLDDSGEISVAGPSGSKLTMDTAGAVKLTCNGNVEISAGSMLKLVGSAGVEIKGAIVQLNPPG